MSKQSNKISVPSRWLLKALSERMQADEQHERGAGIPTLMTFDLFKTMIEQNRLPIQATVIRHPDKDDDEIAFDFGEPDSAVGPFRILSPPKPK